MAASDSSTERGRVSAISLILTVLNSVCQHCNSFMRGTPHRVTGERWEAIKIADSQLLDLVIRHADVQLLYAGLDRVPTLSHSVSYDLTLPGANVGK